MINLLMLILVVTADGFAAAVAMGGSGVRIPWRSAVVIAFTGTLFLGVSAIFSETLAQFIPETICKITSALLLSMLGLYNIFKDFLRKKYEPDMKDEDPAIVFLDEIKADTDKNKIISIKESVLLSAALSADSLIVGALSSGIIGETPLWAVLLIIFAAGLILIKGGNRLGLKAAKIMNFDLTKLCGVILIIFGILNFF
ncbi:MAG: manganese efflux pump [Ruminococcus sp.]|jgi:putative sporulation protein YtaF|nr:manganese efflux pump [Ruminococcus sp.]